MNQFVLVIHRTDGNATYVGPYQSYAAAHKEGDRLRAIPEECVLRITVGILYPHED